MRLPINTLEVLYDSMRYYAFEEYLEMPTLVNNFVLCFQKGLLPDHWRSIDFLSFS